jgi:hypothetical protein
MMNFADLQFEDKNYIYEVDVPGQAAHHVLDNGVSVHIWRNERSDGYAEGKYIVEKYAGASLVEVRNLTPPEINDYLQGLV